MVPKFEIYEILRDFHKITGATISIFALDYKAIASYPSFSSGFCKHIQKNAEGRKNCVASDTKAFDKVNRTGLPYTYKCHCGLYETVAPVYHYGVISGYFVMGQITDTDINAKNNIISLSKKYFDDKLYHQECVDMIPMIDSKLLNSYINILSVIADYMTQTNRITPKTIEIPEKVKEYIDKNFKQKINIEQMSEMFNCSRTTLMNSFKKKFGITIGDFLLNKRIEAAAAILKTTNVMIKTVAIESGFSDQNYFSKAFYNHTGYTPTEYRRNNVGNVGDNND
jgi:AraC-like DNA-binding protein